MIKSLFLFFLPLALSAAQDVGPHLSNLDIRYQTLTRENLNLKLQIESNISTAKTKFKNRIGMFENFDEGKSSSFFIFFFGWAGLSIGGVYAANLVEKSFQIPHQYAAFFPLIAMVAPPIILNSVVSLRRRWERRFSPLEEEFIVAAKGVLEDGLKTFAGSRNLILNTKHDELFKKFDSLRDELSQCFNAALDKMNQNKASEQDPEFHKIVLRVLYMTVQRTLILMEVRALAPFVKSSKPSESTSDFSSCEFAVRAFGKEVLR